MLTHEHKGRLWLEIDRQPYTRRDGTTTELVVWAAQCCADGCTEAVEVKTPVSGFSKSKAFDVKHCPAHKLTREQVNERFRAAVLARRTRKPEGGGP